MTDPPRLEQTGLGYEFVRCRQGSSDDYCYLHQLLACLEADPHDVFSDAYFVARDYDVPWYNTPGNLILKPRHRQHNDD
jgi:hypothetical protein